MSFIPTGDRNIMMVARRVIERAWFGRTTNAAIAPIALNNEYVTAVNAAETGTVDLIKADASNSVAIAGGRAIYNAVSKTIVDGSATSLFDVAVAQSGMSGGVIFYHVQASDGTDFQSLIGMVTYAVVNKAGTLTLTITEVAGNQAKAVSSGTLTLAWTFVTGTLKGTVKLQPTGSLTETTPYTVSYTVFPITGAVTIL